MESIKDHSTAEEPAPPDYEAGPSTPHEPLPAYTVTQPRSPQQICHFRRYREPYQPSSCRLPHGTDLTAWRQYIQLHPPSKKPWEERDASENFHALSSFNLAIDQGKEDLVAFLIEHDTVTANTKSLEQTPLLRAVSKKQVRVVQTLLELGAEKDGFGCVSTYLDPDEGTVRILRTPLQHAASLGHLVLVKLLIEQYGCDDSIVAPDGQIALRLAAENGHQEVVDYLPPRRLGGFRRWKYTHRKALRRSMRALRRIGAVVKFFVWYVPKALLWDLPKHAIVLPIKRGCKWCWDNRKGFGPWCKCQILKVPKVAKWVGRGLAKIPKAAKYVAKGCWKFGSETLPRLIKDISVWLWRFGTETLPRWIKDISIWLWKLVTERLPNAVAVLSRYIANGITKTGKAIWNVVLKIISFLSTVVEAIISFLRSVTLADIWNGFVEVLKAVFVTFPELLLSWVKSLGGLSYKLMKALLGGLGEVLWYIGYGLGWLVLYIPRQIWKILKSFGESFLKGVHEIRVWFDPKAR